MRRSSRVAALLGSVVLATAGALVTRAGDLTEQIERLMRGGHYDLAREIYEDRVARGEALDQEARWLGAQLSADPEEFDRRVHDLLQRGGTEDPRRRTWITARAIEHFAQGRYQTAVDLLQGVDEAQLFDDPRAPLFLGMALQALGQNREADLVFARVSELHPAHAAAVVLRAELAARKGDTRSARGLAGAVADDPDYGAQARLILAQVALAEGRKDEASDWMQRIRRDFPEAVEGSWTVTADQPPPERVEGFEQRDAPDPRRDYALQLGAFRDRSLALRYARRLMGRVEGLRIEVDRRESPPWYRVVCGSFVTRVQAQREAARLAEEQISALVLGPGRGNR